MPIIDVSGLVKNYGNFPVFDGISLTFNQGFVADQVLIDTLIVIFKAHFLINFIFNSNYMMGTVVPNITRKI